MRRKWLPSTAVSCKLLIHTHQTYVGYLFCFHPSTILNKEMKEHRIKIDRGRYIMMQL